MLVKVADDLLFGMFVSWWNVTIRMVVFVGGRLDPGCISITTASLGIKPFGKPVCTFKSREAVACLLVLPDPGGVCLIQSITFKRVQLFKKINDTSELL